MSSCFEKFEVSPHVSLYTSNGRIAGGDVRGIEFYGRNILVQPSEALPTSQVKFLAMAAVGMTSTEIAGSTPPAAETIKDYQSSSYQQLGASTIVHATRRLFEEGVLVPFYTSYRGQRLKVSERDVEILDIMSQGYSIPKTAEKLDISPHTVKTHISNIAKRHDMKGFGTAGLVMSALFDGELEVIPPPSNITSLHEPVLLVS